MKFVAHLVNDTKVNTNSLFGNITEFDSSTIGQFKSAIAGAELDWTGDECQLVEQLVDLAVLEEQTPPMDFEKAFTHEWVNECDKLTYIAYVYMTSSGNVSAFLRAHDDVVDYHIIGFRGTRGAFYEHVLRRIDGNPSDVFETHHDEDEVTRDWLPHPWFRYETTGPQQMFPWEQEGNYLIRRVCDRQAATTYDATFKEVSDRVAQKLVALALNKRDTTGVLDWFEENQKEQFSRVATLTSQLAGAIEELIYNDK